MQKFSFFLSRFDDDKKWIIFIKQKKIGGKIIAKEKNVYIGDEKN